MSIDVESAMPMIYYSRVIAFLKKRSRNWTSIISMERCRRQNPTERYCKK